MGARRVIRRRTAGSLMKSLGCTSLDSDHFFDYLGILWMQLGCWGEDHPVEILNSSFWNDEEAIYILYDSKEISKKRENM